MLTEDMKLWHGIAIAAVSLLLQTCLLAVISYLLSRHMAYQKEQRRRGTTLQAHGPVSGHHHPPSAKEMGTWAERAPPVPAPRLRHDSDTSSDSLDYSSSMPPTCQVKDTQVDLQATKDVDYTQVAFLSPRGLKNVSSLDYENMTEATDYVNVDPKSRKLNLWTCVNPVVFEPVEYSQVAM